MILTGFTDEASNDLDEQIKVTKALGWDYLSARTIGANNIHEISEAAFEAVCEKLQAHNIKIAEFGTLIGNWSKDITSDWSITEAELNRCIPRMQKLGVKYARIMSYAQKKWGDDQLEQERFKRLRAITARFKDAGLEALHENCMNWGGFSADHTLRLIEEVPDLRLVFDTGNPIFQRDRSQPAPHPWQRPFEFYQKIKHAIAHVHVKDAIMKKEDGEPEYTFAGEGDAQLDLIFSDLKKSGYEGFVAIEPHVGKVFHLNDQDTNPEKAYEIYLTYGKRFEQFLENI
ncbi:MAG: sugar phosphate isomerase/epimerase [Bacteroidota bacterium]